MKHVPMQIPGVLLLASLLLLASCSSPNDPTQPEVTTAAATAAETVEPGNADLLIQKIGAQDFGDTEFRVFSPDPGLHFYKNVSPENNEIWFEGESGELLADAVYKRNLKTEELLNITIKPIWGGDTGDVADTTKNNVLAGDDFTDAVLCGLSNMMNLASQKILFNLNEIDTLDLSNPWWDQTIIQNFSVKNQLYVLCGDIVYYDDFAVSALFGNKRIMSELDMEVPYQLVRDGKWTFDIFSEMVKEGYADLNGDGVYDHENDRFGFTDHASGMVLHMIYNFDQTLASKTEDGSIVVNYNEALFEDVNTIIDFMKRMPATTVEDGYGATFKDGRALFYPSMIGGSAGMRSMADDYCILPLPKGDEAQERYTAYVSNGWATCYAVPVTGADTEKTGTILEVMSAASSDTITPALYDYMFAEKYVRDQESLEMLEYVWASHAYDLAVDTDWGGGLRDLYHALEKKASNDFASKMEKKLKSINRSLDTFLSGFEDE